MEDCHKEALKPRMLVLAPQQQPTTEGKTPLKNPAGEKSRSLPMRGGGAFLRPPPYVFSARSCLLLSVVLIYFSVNVHEIILDDLIDRRLDGPTVFLI